MLNLRIGISALAVSALTVSACALHSPPEVEVPSGNDCGECYHGWSEAMCQAAELDEPCHDWVYNGEQPWGGGSCHEHEELGSLGLYFAMEDCFGHQWCGNPNCATEEEEELLAAVDQLATTTSLDEAYQVMEIFVDVPGVWLELNRDRVAVQVLTESCRPGSGGQVIQHIPLGEDMVRVWEAAFSVN